jgi:hypothetical protein
MAAVRKKRPLLAKHNPGPQNMTVVRKKDRDWQKKNRGLKT